MGDEWCSQASPCPCGCGWALCGVFGEWVERPDCEGCGCYGKGDDGEED